jgi:hypothetical protein
MLPSVLTPDDVGTTSLIGRYLIESEQDSDFRSTRPKIILLLAQRLCGSSPQYRSIDDTIV